jgi:CubicO group peptidase (beta-lactamase class C family)
MVVLMGNIRRSTILILISILFVLVPHFTLAAKVTPDKYPRQSEIDAAIRIIEFGLKPLVVVKNRPARDFSLVKRMKYYNVPGVGIAVIYGGALIWAGGYGIADMETGKPVDEETLFRAASISKPVTAAAALRLVDKGLLKLDTPVNKQLTSWLIPDNKFTNGWPVTLRHLLSHSGGLSDDPDLSFQQDQTIPTLVEILDGTLPARTAAVNIDTIPGSTGKYSNQGYCIIQLMMSDITGRTFSDLMDDLILVPAGMTGSTFRQYLPEGFIERATTGYRSNGDELPKKRLICPAMAAAGLWTTPTDLARFTLSIMRSYAGDEDALLNEESAAEMLTVQTGDFGLGFTLEGSGDELSFSHGGASDGYRCFMLAYPAKGEGAVIMTNSDAGQGLYLEILRGLASEYGWANYLPEEKAIVFVETDKIRVFEGVYLLDGRVKLRFNVEKDHLLMTSPSNSYNLFPESDTKFFDIDYGFTINFVRDASGVVSEAVLDRGGVLSTLYRSE